MTPEEAKFILLACRRPGAGEADARAAEALAMMEKDPELAAWFAREAVMDAALEQALEDIEPPTGLKEAILARAPGAAGNSSTPIPFPTTSHTSWWRNPRWISLAAGIVLLLSFSFLLMEPQDLKADDDLPEFYHEVARHVGKGMNLQVEHDDLDYLRAFLQAQGSPAPGYLPGRVDPLDEVGALVHVWRERPVGVVVMRNHAHYHLYVVDNAAFRSPPDFGREPRIKEVGQVAILVWVDGDQLHVLATTSGKDALAELL